MKVNSVEILNWEPPGGPWWKMVSSSPDEPLIEARMQLTLTHKEYKELLAKDDRNEITHS